MTRKDIFLCRCEVISWSAVNFFFFYREFKKLERNFAIYHLEVKYVHFVRRTCRLVRESTVQANVLSGIK